MLGRERANRIRGPGAENIDTELLQLGSINFGKLYRQHHLTLVRRHYLQGAYDLGRIRGRHLVQVFGGLGVRNVAGQNQAAAVHLHPDLLIGIGVFDGAAQARYVEIDDHVEHLRAPRLVPEDQAAGARGPALDHNFCPGSRQRLNHRRIAG